MVYTSGRSLYLNYKNVLYEVMGEGLSVDKDDRPGILLVGTYELPCKPLYGFQQKATEVSIQVSFT